MTGPIPYTIAELTPHEFERDLGQLSSLLLDVVLDGASINFILPFSEAQAENFWTRKVCAPLQAGTLLVLVARRNGRIVGSVQLDHDTPPNQPHRAEVRKLLVHPSCRRMGIARALMAELESRAPKLGRTLLNLDTRTGDKAEPLYTSLGYITVGTIPEFCRDTIVDRLDATTIMYKKL